MNSVTQVVRPEPAHHCTEADKIDHIQRKVKMNFEFRFQYTTLPSEEGGDYYYSKASSFSTLDARERFSFIATDYSSRGSTKSTT